jgi:hypothetical protein
LLWSRLRRLGFASPPRARPRSGRGQTTTPSSRARSKPELSTLLESGTFYFALTGCEFGLSSLFRNVPALTSIEVSPFWPSETARFFFLSCRRLPGQWESGNPAFGFPLSHRPPQSGFLLLLLSPISHRRRRSCGNVGPVLRTQGVVERGEILPFEVNPWSETRS